MRTRNLNLTTRQEEVIKGIARSEKSCAIAERLGITDKTVQYHRSAVTLKLGLQPADTAALTRWAIREGLVQP